MGYVLPNVDKGVSEIRKDIKDQGDRISRLERDMIRVKTTMGIKEGEKMSNKTKDILIRALKTFWQVALAYLIAAVSGLDFFGDERGKTFWVGIAVSALAAGLSAAYNGVIKPLFSGVSVDEDGNS